jgi:enoyl-CoA hydratase/carnithine racemase
MTVSAAPAEYYPQNGVVRIDAPDSGNALPAEVQAAIAAGCREFDQSEAISCIVIAGTDTYFASGPAAADEFWAAVDAIETPLVAAVAGYALGAGWELALACDLTIAAENCDFGIPEVTVGLPPSAGAARRIAAVIGKQRAMELIITGRRISGQEAFRLGLVNLATRKKEWFDQAILMAERIGKRPPEAVRLAKRAVRA